MKLKFRRKAQRGLSLLEILVAIVVLTVTLISFASVFPAAFKLNRQSQKSVMAAKHAAAVAEELRSLPIAGNLSKVTRPGTSSKGYLESYMPAYMGTTNPDVYCKNLSSVSELTSKKYRGDQMFSLQGPKSKAKGVSLEHIGGGSGTNDSRFWTIKVTVFWLESVNGQPVERFASVVSARSGNR